MTSTMEFTESLQDGFVKALETGQRVTLEALGAGMSSVKNVLPTTPTLPFATAVISPEDAINATFGFAEKIMAAQKSFLTEIVELAESK